MATATKVKTPDLSKVGDFVEKNWKPLVYIGGAIVVIIVASKLIKTLFAPNSLFGESTSDPSNIVINPLKLSMSEADLIMVTEGLYDAMNRVGTREDDVIDLLTPLNGEDLKFVIKTFGLRKYDPIFGTGSGIIGANKTLQGWLKSELSGRYLDQVTELFNQKKVPF